MSWFMELPDRVRYFGIFSFAALVTLEHFFVMKRDKVLMSLFLFCVFLIATIFIAEAFRPEKVILRLRLLSLRSHL
jgi:hypothetical protein